MVQLIGLYSPVPQSGKSETAKILCEHGYIIHPFAKPLKEVCVKFVCAVTGMNESSAKQYFYTRKNVQIPGMAKGVTGRGIMQKMGTDFARNMIDRDIWLKAWKREYTEFGKTFCVIVDDVRIANEAELIRSIGGQLWRVTRKPAKKTADCDHESEGGLEDVMFDVEIANDGSLEDLRATILAVVKSFNDK